MREWTEADLIIPDEPLDPDDVITVDDYLDLISIASFHKRWTMGKLALELEDTPPGMQTDLMEEWRADIAHLDHVQRMAGRRLRRWKGSAKAWRAGLFPDGKGDPRAD